MKPHDTLFAGKTYETEEIKRGPGTFSCRLESFDG